MPGRHKRSETVAESNIRSWKRIANDKGGIIPEVDNKNKGVLISHHTPRVFKIKEEK